MPAGWAVPEATDNTRKSMAARILSLSIILLIVYFPDVAGRMAGKNQTGMAA